MSKGDLRWKQKLLAFTMSSILVLVLLGAGELFCRIFLDINLRKTSREFVTISDRGFVTGNEPNAKGISFGVPVFSDKNGFRVPAGYSYQPADEAILLVGDSVTFGVGVPEEATFAGRLRTALPAARIYNSGVIGFAIPDYVRTVEKALSEKGDIKKVYLFYCLNDFQAPDVYTKPTPSDTSLWKSVKRAVANGFIWVNEFFGPRSKLYVFLTGMTIDPSRQYYLSDIRNMDVDDARFEEVMRPLVEIGRGLEQRGIGYTIVLSPYEVQLRRSFSDGFEPQERVRRYLNANGIRTLDTRERFQKLEDPSRAFLFADPMHLSPAGHELVYETLIEDLNRPDKTE